VFKWNRNDEISAGLFSAIALRIAATHGCPATATDGCPILLPKPHKQIRHVPRIGSDWLCG
jgi:hypothetical protein